MEIDNVQRQMKDIDESFDLLHVRRNKLYQLIQTINSDVWLYKKASESICNNIKWDICYKQYGTNYYGSDVHIGEQGLYIRFRNIGHKLHYYRFKVYNFDVPEKLSIDRFFVCKADEDFINDSKVIENLDPWGRDVSDNVLFNMGNVKIEYDAVHQVGVYEYKIKLRIVTVNGYPFVCLYLQ